MEFKKGQLLVYGVRGVCRVEDVRREALGTEEKEYCILRPLDDPKATIYLPTDSDRIEKNIKRVITAEEIDRLIRSIPTEDDKWIDDNKRRSELFKRILDDGDRLNLVRLIKSIHIHRDEIEKSGKKQLTLTFAEIGEIAGVPLDHSFLKYKKELCGYEVTKISMRAKTVLFTEVGEKAEKKED